MTIKELTELVKNFIVTDEHRDELVARLKEYDAKFEKKQRENRVTELLNKRIDL